MHRRLQFGFIFLVLLGTANAQTSATFGDVISLGTQPGDIVLDQPRQRVYMINTAANRVDIWDYAAKRIAGSIAVGQSPLAGAMSMDGAYLYVTNHDAASLSVISLASSTPTASFVSLSAKPQGVEVGADGRVLISTDGSGTGGTANTLLIYDGRQGGTNQVLPVTFAPPAATPPTLPQLQQPPTTTFNGKLLRTPNGAYIVGVSNFTNNGQASTVVFVYEAVSGTVLRSRIVVGQSSTMSMSPDGATFMAGFRLFDIATLNGIAQQSTANAMFAATTAFSTTTNVGGSVFSPDGKTLYGAFNSAPNATPTPASQSATLLISDPRNLAINLAINLPESIVGKMVITSDGAEAFAVSASGVTHLPLGKLYTYPILMPESTVVFLAQDDCHPGIAQTKLKIRNIGGGTLTYAVSPTLLPQAAVEVNADSGLAPSTVTFTMDPGRSAVLRTPGTNLYTGATPAANGTAINVTLQSPNAINVPPAIRVYLNYRDSTMRGIVFPVPTTPNSSAAANEGLQDIVLDESRHSVYISNSGYNRIEVFDTQKMQFVAPIPVGQRPHQMAMGLDGSTLYVANAGGESLSIVDLDLQQVIGGIQFPTTPSAGNAAPVAISAMAMGLQGLELVVTNGTTNTLWKVVGNQAQPRVGTTITGINATTGAQNSIAAPLTMLGSDDGSSVVLLSNSGAAYLYDGLSDAYTSARQLFTNSGTTIIFGYYGPLGVASQGQFLLSNGLVMNSSLTPIGGAVTPGQVSITPPIGPGGGGGGVTVSSTGLRNVAAVTPVGDHAFLRMTTPVRTNLTTATSDDVHTTLEAVDTQSGATVVAARMPDNPAFPFFGTAAKTPMPARQMVIDSQGTVYAITLSGLSVMPITPATAATQPAFTAKSITNSNDGTANFKPGSFITIKGTNLASNGTATTLPIPTVLGGSCVLFGQVAIPLLQTSSGQITAQIPSTVRPGPAVVQVRSLSMAQQSTPILVTVQKP
jgi:DNA-binding beta-propeller fold protein YncE